MRITALFLFVLISCLCAENSNSQNIRVTVKRNNVEIENVLNDIEKQTDYLFVYNKYVNVNRKVSVNMNKRPLDEVLSRLFEGTEVKYALDGSYIILSAGNGTENTANLLLQQGRKIVGTVKGPDGEPLIGANVIEKGTSNGTVADIKGTFSIDVSEGSIIQISYIGCLPREIKIGKDSSYDIVLQEDQKLLEEVVVVGYTSVKRGLLTGSVASMNVKESIESMPTTNAGDLLTGMVPGVNVQSSHGFPGSTPKISVRTQSSWNKQSVTYVIDGRICQDEKDFNNLSPLEIENITVLKDAAAAAVYGSRSAGGVVLVTTKRGNVGKTIFRYSFNAGFDKRTKNTDRTSGVQAGELYNRINGASDPAGWAWSQEELDYFKTVNNGWGYDQLEAVWNTPSTMSHNLSASGGSEKIKFFTGFSYFQQQSFLKPIQYDKYNFRLNLTADLTKDLQLFAATALNYNKTNSITWDPNDVYGKLLIWQPDQPVYTDGGKHIDYGWIANVGAAVDGEEGYKNTDYLNPTLQVSLNYKVPFVEGLNAKVSYNHFFTDSYEKTYETKYDMYVMKKSGVNNRITSTKDEDIVGVKKSTRVGKESLRAQDFKGQGRQLNLQLLYDRHFDRHHVQGTFVYETMYRKDGGFYGKRETFPVYRTDQWWAASGDRANTDAGGVGKIGDIDYGGADLEDGRISYIGQFNYEYANKYLFNFSFREDGSMKFAPDERWGFFPAGSVGWVISEESFFSDNIKKINYMKLRASAGLTGNDGVGGWQWQQSYVKGNSAYFGAPPASYTGIKYGSIVNPYLTWEKSLTYNVAVDMNYFRNWSTTVEYWFRKTYDILGSRGNVVPTTFSRSMPDENYGKVNAQGFDLNIGYRNTTGDWGYSANLAMSYGWNRVIDKYYAENAMEKDIPVGKSDTNIYGYVFDRIIRTQGELDAFNAANPAYQLSGYKPEIGMMVYKDVSGPNGNLDGIIDNWDQVMLQKDNFPIVYGLNLGATWKGFSVDVLFSGRLKEKKSFKSLADNVEWNRMWEQWYSNSWTPENPNAMLPKRYSANDGMNTTYRRESVFWLQDASFMRLKYLNVAYSIPRNLYGGVFDKVRVYFSGTNLFCLSNFKYYDPELDGGFQYPVMRSFNFGIDVTF